MLLVEIWSDVVCPFCYIGKKRFDDALTMFAHRDEVEVKMRAFQLDPSSPPILNETIADILSRKHNMTHDQAIAAVLRTTAMGAAEGLEFHLDEARSGNTMNAHRLLHLADKYGLQLELSDRLFRAYFTEKRAIGDKDNLVQIAIEAGISHADAVEVLESDMYASEVELQQNTARELGVTAVPFIVVDRKYAVKGAQSTDVFLDVLQQAWNETNG